MPFNEKMSQFNNKKLDSHRPSFSRLGILLPLVVELFLFFVTSILLTYFGGTQNWNTFAVAALVALALFIVVQLLKSKPVLSYFHELEEKEFDTVQRMKQFGIVNFYNMQDFTQQDRRNSDTRSVIAQASVMYLAANSAASYIDPGVERHWSAIKQRLDNKIIFNILILDPFSSEKRVRDNLNLTGDSPDSKFRFDILCQLYNNYPNVSIRVSTSQMYCTVFYTQDEMFYDPYHLGKLHGRITNKFLCLRLTNQSTNNNGESYYNILQNHFDALWLGSADFENYFVENKELITQMSPSIKELQFRHRH